MTTNNPPLVLLDLQNEYQTFEGIFNSQLFCRFTTTAQCLEHLSSRPVNSRPLHLFLPKSEHTIMNPTNLFSNITFYIYCMNEQSIIEMNRQYPFPSIVRIFDVESLLMNLRGAETLHWIEQANRTIHEPDEYDIALGVAAESAETLAKELREYMYFKTGVQPDD